MASYVANDNIVRGIAMFLCLGCVAMSNLANLVAADFGTATSYNPPYLPTRCNGGRQDQFPAGNMFVAVGEGLWDNGAACGRRYRMRCLSGANRPCKEGTMIDVKVVDYCRISPCPATFLLSNDAFNAISHHPNAKINIEYAQT
ncbi:unnamed protein product [Linum tenue]|uniref:Expansin-like EG45 domain-containing protein n=1 Tax=Linum tenue TaxID=586396 RepID=A0AAV0JZV4_9ROSI|nr:unnamed protein product [Linum tenue]